MALDKVVDSAALDAGMTSVANAIRAKTGDADLLAWPDGFVAAISGIETGGGGGGSSSTSPNDVNFYDYDGTIVASYSLSEAQAITALPDGPIHEGLTFQGWNYTLENVKAFTRPMNVGAMYITDDGKTRLHIRIAAEGRMNVPLYISQTVENGVTIDWGDGSATETLAGTGNVNTTHTYASIGDYTITLDPAEGCTLGFGNGSSSYCVLGSTGNNGKVYCNFLKSVRIGDGVTNIGSNAFKSCYSLANITIPESVTSIGDTAFQICYSLASITIPESVSSIGDTVFQGCYSLASITIPESVTSIGINAFSACASLASITIPESVTSIGVNAFGACTSLANITVPESITSINKTVFASCTSLANITIPESVTSIGNNAFGKCYGMAEYHLKPTTPPTLSNANAFNIPSDCVIYVPVGYLGAYKNATNWATHASKMQEEPA